ncbi:MAG TPA: aminotransferase class I/II-fold pyridoxal phosphate-dependent enzyme [Nocardioidaceae bacterium]|nr:aminotransferase class I/II-fold pyridoxal phosphate-dependent enzyme [Nocardioidaceae bacterium]
MTGHEPILGASLEELRATRSSVKWRAYPPDVLPAWVAEMDARPCAPVVEAVTAALRRGDTGYPWVRPFEDAFTGFAKRRWGWAPEPGPVVADVMIGIAELLHVLTPTDGAVVLSPPCYDSFYGFVASVRRRLVTAPLSRRGGADHRLDPEALDRAFADAGPGSAYVLCNPQNPTGTVHTADELATLARIAGRRGVTVISDEIHAPLVQPGTTYTPYLAVPEAARGIAVVSASKAWNLAGLKAAMVVPGPEARDAVGALHEVVTHGANHLGVIAQTAAYAEGEAWLDQLLGEVADRRALLARLLAERLPAVVPTPAQATYLAWLDCRGLGLADPAEVFLERGRVAVSAGTLYDPAATGWVRFNLATSAEVVTEAVARMAAAVA